jgi:membrane protease YdiL (CAAX protease family)
LPVTGLFWLKVPFWLAPVAVLAATRRAGFADLGFTGPPMRAVAFAAAGVALMMLKDFLRLDLIDQRPPAWSPPLPTLLMAVAPALEELLFRGALQPVLVRREGPLLGIVLTALLFLLIHLPGWVLLHASLGAFTIVYVFAFGLFLGWLRHASGSIWASFLTHWINNVGARL